MHGDEQLCRKLEQLVGRHRKMIEILCQRASYGWDDTYRDLVQECYVALLEHLHKRSSDISELYEGAWVYWRCRGAITRFRRAREQHLQPMSDDALPDTETSTHEVTQMTFDELTAGLSPSERRVFALMADGVSDEEIARQMGVKIHTVSQMRHNIKKKLQQYLKQ